MGSKKTSWVVALVALLIGSQSALAESIIVSFNGVTTVGQPAGQFKYSYTLLLDPDNDPVADRRKIRLVHCKISHLTGYMREKNAGLTHDAIHSPALFRYTRRDTAFGLSL